LFNDLDVDAIGINCTLTPEKMVPLVKKLVALSKKPVFVEPNAGKPVLSADGKLTYKTTLKNSLYTSKITLKWCEYRRWVLWNRTGTHQVHGPTYWSEKNQKTRNVEELNVVTSRVHMVNVAPFLVVGERINASARKKLHNEIREFSFESVLKLAKSQEQEGAQVIDVNFGIESVLSEEHFSKAFVELDKIVSIPISFDIQYNEFLESALMEYPGRPLINSSKATRKNSTRR